ncbi:MAG: M6 family metalloprotease domain-containing protein [Gemmatimonadaceae bacterium]
MSTESQLVEQLEHIRNAALASDNGERCTVSPSPELKLRLKAAVDRVRADASSDLGPFLRTGEPQRPGLNDGLIIPPEEFPLGTSMSNMRAAVQERAPLAGVLRVIVVLVDFTDKHMTQTAAHYQDLFFSNNPLAPRSVRDYYKEVTHGIIDIQGQVVGPFRMPQTIATYAHGASGLGAALPNATTMARDALVLADPAVNFAPFDNNGDGFVDAFIVIHAGSGAEVTGSSADIWSHKWTLAGGARTVDGTKVFGYLTVPEDAKIGVCCHELGHLLFGFPDLYDTDNSSEGIGNWCLMAAGSWGGGGDKPVHPSAWCKANQGWATVDNRTTNGSLSMPDVKTSHIVYRLWKDGTPSSEYFLVENRQRTGFDVSLPAPGLLIWHIDESIGGNTNESHYKVALMQSDGHRDLELNHNRGDTGDPYPGSANNTAFTASSTPNSNAYSGASTCVAVTGISASGPVMTANVQVKCKVIKETKEIKKEIIKEKELTKELKDAHKETKELTKELKDAHKETKELTKEVKDAHKEIKEISFDKPVIDKKIEKKIEKPNEKVKDIGGGGGIKPGVKTGGQHDHSNASLEARLEQVESMLSQLISGMGDASGQSSGSSQPFIGTELRPDLSQGALMGEDDYSAPNNDMQGESAMMKRHLDKADET